MFFFLINKLILSYTKLSTDRLSQEKKHLPQFKKPLSESDEFDEEVIYPQESPKMEEFFRDFDWELDRFVQYRLPIKKPL